MNKNNISEKILSIRVPEPLFEKFKTKCDDNFKSMSDTIRDFMREYAKCGNLIIKKTNNNE